MKTCSVKGCGRPSVRLGLCESHLARAWKGWDPDGAKSFRPRGSAREAFLPHKFWSFVRKSKRSKCWLWGGPLKGRYGSFHWHGGHSAHTFSWFIHNGPIPPNMEVCHSCDVPLCVNPNHLFVDTHKGNLQDAARKGRMNRGERNASHKATEAMVREIRALRKAGQKYKELSARFGLCADTIMMIVKRRSWKHVT